jgi:hypothetical protein
LSPATLTGTLKESIVTSFKKVKANRANARHSSGPKTATGKNNSRRNALKHGFFSPELVLSNAEKVEDQAFHRALHSQHQPTTALQRMALDRIVFCDRRCKLAARHEMRQLSVLFDIPRDREIQPERPMGSAAIARWYLSGRRELSEGIKILEALEQEFARNGRVPADWKPLLDSAFGVEFFELLTNWPTISLDTILLAHHLAEHKKTFRRGDSCGDDKKLLEVVSDPVQSLRMVGKLIEQQLQHLRDLARSWEHGVSGSAGGQTAGTMDFAPRYFTSASRDLHRAVEWFAHLKERNL